ncbi:hypothetical protein C8B47_08930 [filamentous cyanobacterium CCP4]|nr:hypothetical protein C8B47_08930 [filamentous cyanobacterium CCP4]
MTSTSQSIWLAVAPLVVISGASVLIGSAYGQSLIIPDATLGNEPSQVVNTSKINGLPSELVTGGAQRGQNIFHSFSEFNIGEGGRVYFDNPIDIQNIFSRVTGNNPSNIFGTLGVDGPANLFFLNPNGILFGLDASLDIDGSFFATTAESFTFEDGSEFSATNPQNSSLLTVSVPLGLQDGQPPTDSVISNQGTLSVGQNLTFSANQLSLQGQLGAGENLTLQATDNLQIRDTSEAPFVAAARGNLLIQGNESVDIFALNHPDGGLFAGEDLVLRSANPVGGDAHYWSGEDFRVEGLDGTLGGLFSPIDPIIRTLGDVTIGTYEGGSLHILAGGSVTIGTVEITAPEGPDLDVDFLRETITLTDGTVVQIDGNAQPTLDVRAGVAPEAIGIPHLALLTGFDGAIDDFSANSVADEIPASADITVGDVVHRVVNGLVLLTNQYEPDETLDGNIVITGNGNLGLGINAQNFAGQGGTVYIDARNDIDVIGSLISTTAQRDVGDIVLIADGTVRFDGTDGSRTTGAYANIAAGGEGPGGNVRINAANLDVRNGAQITSAVFGNGQGGDVLLNITGTARFVGADPIDGSPSGAFSRIDSDGEGTGGNVALTATNLEVRDGAVLDASSFGIGDAGSVILTIAELARFVGTDPTGDSPSGASSSIERDGEGTGGNVELTAANLEVLDGAQLGAGSFGIGDAGSVILTIEELARFVGTNPTGDGASGAFSSIERDGEGTGGNVELTAANLEVRDGAQLSASSLGMGDAGSVILTIEELARFVGTDPTGDSPSGAFSRIDSDGEGTGGNVALTATNLEVRDGAVLDASSFGIGDAGSVILTIAELARFVGTDPTGDSSSGAFSTIQPDGEGTGGNVALTATNLEVLDGAQLSAASFGIGDAGSVILTIDELARFVGTDIDGSPSGAFSVFDSDEEGTGGNVELTATNLEVRDGAFLSTANLGVGDAGDIVLFIPGQILVDDGTIEANAETASGGQINVQSGRILLRNDSDIQTFINRGAGGGGNITLTADSILAFDDSDILAFAQDGQGGNIILDTPAFFGENYQPSPEGINPFSLDGNRRVDINASGAISGIITLPDVSFVENSLTSLPDTVVDTNQLIAGSCIARTNTEGSFIVSGRGGLPNRPSSTFTAPYSTGSIRPLPATEADNAWQTGDPVVEPEGVFQLPDGQVVISQRCAAE